MNRSCRTRDDAGSVAAEFAVTLPAVLIVLAIGVGALAAGAQTVRLQDASADAARALARGDPPEAARTIAGTAAVSVSMSVTRREGLVCVELSSPLRVGGLAGLGFSVSASSCALDGGL